MIGLGDGGRGALPALVILYTHTMEFVGPGKAEELMKNARERADSIRKAKNVEEKVSGMDDAAIRDAARKWVRDD